jgi:pyrroloquinoline-quinone synthase
MQLQTFLAALEERIAAYDLLCHPYYKAWTAGQLTREDLREYAGGYYHHVAAFPTYLSALHSRLQDGEVRRAVLRNLCGEEIEGRAHSELWLDFAEGMGAARDMHWHRPVAEVRELMKHFHRVASEGTPEEALAAFYVYESQVPRVAREKERGLREMYSADDKTCGYFELHTTADVFHSKVWRAQLEKRLEANPEAAQGALDAAESTAKMLWRALDGIDAARMSYAA